jgi:general secretion pathway protein L
LNALNALRRRHVPVLEILRQLSDELPADAWFTRFSIVDGKGDVEGHADSASALIPLLAASPLLGDVSFLSPITKGKDGKETFRIGFTVK